MKTIYFVRHGESEANAANSFNAPDTPLSERGREQATQIAERCEKLPIETIVASSLLRAQQTATVVSERVGRKFESSDLFVEGMYAKKVPGRKIDDVEIIQIIETYHKNFAMPGFRIDGGENFEDLKKRALAALSYLEKKPEENILVVSHGFFLWIIAATTVFGNELTAEECRGVIRGFDLMENTALTVLTYGAPLRKAMSEPASPWQLKVWNDHAHLG